MPIYYFLRFFLNKKSKACSSWKRCAQISVRIAFLIYFEWMDPCKWHVTNPFVLAYTQKSLSYIVIFIFMSCPHLFPLGRAMLRTSGNLPSSLTSIWLVKTKRNNRRAQKEEINSISYKVMGKREQKDQHLSKSHQNNWPAAQIKPARKRRSFRRCLTVPLST